MMLLRHRTAQILSNGMAPGRGANRVAAILVQREQHRYTELVRNGFESFRWLARWI
jgi:hypothetical protein